MSEEKKYTAQQKHLRSKYVRFPLDLKPEILETFKEKCAAAGTTPTTEIKKFINSYICLLYTSAVMFGSISEGKTEITNFLNGADCLSTIDCFRRLGIEIETLPERIVIHGRGLHGLKKPTHILDVGNSGTTTRLLCGILSGQPFESILDGDDSIRTRPMKRIITPLSQMGAEITSLNGNGCAPLCIRGTRLKSITYTSPVASAQVKSAILLAGLYADGETSVIEPALSRNHSELMLNYFGAEVTTHNTTITIQPDPVLIGQKVNVPGDISSAAYFIAAALMVPGSEILIKNVGINPTRDGILRVCQAMGCLLYTSIIFARA